MSVEDLDVLHKQMPELFEERDLPENWGDDLIIVPVPDVERITRTEGTRFKEEPAMIPEAFDGETLDDGGLAVGETLDALGPESIGRGPVVSRLNVEVRLAHAREAKRTLAIGYLEIPGVELYREEYIVDAIGKELFIRE
jgi:hypothetical protein